MTGGCPCFLRDELVAEMDEAPRRAETSVADASFFEFSVAADLLRTRLDALRRLAIALGVCSGVAAKESVSEMDDRAREWR